VAGLGVASALLPLGAAAQTMDDHIYTYVAFDEIEYARGGAGHPIAYDGEAWIGGDFDRLWLRAHGHQETRRGGDGEFEAQVLYSRVVSAFWNAQGGLRVDHHYGHGERATRGLVALGVAGLAPYWFEVESFLFVSQDGYVSARLKASYDLLFTQRMIFEPEFELNAAAQKVPEFGTGSGLTDLTLGARLRFEIVREFAPYVGVAWTRRMGGTADLARAGGVPVGDAAFVAGVRWWY
jgi:copper resistance protein B